MGPLHGVGCGKHGLFSRQSIKRNGPTTLSLTQTQTQTDGMHTINFHSLISLLMFPILLDHKLNQVPQRDDLANQQQHAHQVPPEAPPPLPLPRRRLEPLVDLTHILPVICQLTRDRIQLRVLHLDTLWVLGEEGGKERQREEVREGL